MSTLNEIAESKITIGIEKPEGIAIKLVKSLINAMLLALLIYISQGSKFWTLICGIIFIFYLWLVLKNLFASKAITFSSRAAAVAFIQKQEWLDE